MSGIEITRRDLTAAELRAAAGKSRDAKAARRMLALALVLEGVDRTRAAETCGMVWQTLRGAEGQETVRGTVSPTNGYRYNAEGLAGPVFVKQVVRRFYAASLISEALVSRSGFSQTGPAGCQLRVFPDHRSGFWARAFA